MLSSLSSVFVYDLVRENNNHDELMNDILKSDRTQVQAYNHTQAKTTNHTPRFCHCHIMIDIVHQGFFYRLRDVGGGCLRHNVFEKTN